MNINFVCAARNADSQKKLSYLFEAAVDDAERIFPNSDGHRWVDGASAVYNANGVAGTWEPSPWHEEGGDLIAVSQPPIPVDTACTPADYWDTVGKIVRRGEFGRFLPNHFGIHKTADRTIKIWSDVLGLGRCYYVINSDFVAASNHIGILAYFLQSDVEMNVDAVSRYAHTEWFTLDDSPIVGIRRLAEGTVIEVDPAGEVAMYEHSDLQDLVGSRDQSPDFAGVVDQTRVVAANLDSLSVRTPTVMLSGGRDSRMTASIWLSSGNSARVVTMGTLLAEAEIAERLMGDFFDREQGSDGVSHVITQRKTSSITMTLEDRLERAFLMWDGDAAPINIRSNVPTPTGSFALNIGGVGGEITHGYYYDHLDAFGPDIAGPNPLMHARRKYRANSVTEFAQKSMRDYFDIVFEKAQRDNRTDIISLDYLYLNEKYRRWGNQALNSTSAIMLSSPAFVRAAFDMTPEDHVRKSMPTALVERAMPSWAEVEYYKATAAESKASMAKKLATFDTDPEYFFTTLAESEIWPVYLDSDRVGQFISLVRDGEAAPVHEALLNRAIWIDYMAKHINGLSSRVRQVHSSFRPSITVRDRPYSALYSEELQSGFFVTRRTDSALFDQVVAGRLEVGGREVDIFDSRSYDDMADLSRADQLFLHSLRWADVLRRSQDAGTDNADLWTKAIGAWAASTVAQDSASLAWSGPVLLQRSTVLVLGMKAGFRDDLTDRGHLERLQKVGSDLVEGSARLNLLRVELGLMDQLGLPESEISDYLCAVAMSLFHESGYVSAADLTEILALKSQWENFLTSAGIRNDDEALQRVRATTFWEQSLSPTGALIPMGSRMPASEALPSTPSTRYVASQGMAGLPPEAVKCVVPFGPVLLHSGWGETERNVEDETALSFLLGPVRGRSAHQDLSRITFTSQGRDWLVDPPRDEMAGAAEHSTVYVDGQRYRHNGESELIREYSDGEVDGFVVNNTPLRPVQWRRHVVFARTDNYAVVSDVVRSSEAFSAFQQWIVAPDVHIEAVRGGFVLRAAEGAVRLSVTSRNLRDSVVEPICDALGDRLAWRIRVPLSGKSARSTVVISDIDPKSEGLPPELQYFGAEFAVRYRTGRIDELLVVTPEKSVVFPGDLDPEECISLAIDRAASGELDETEALAQRLSVREKIAAVKQEIRESGGNLSRRKKAIDELVNFGDEAHVQGLRDHGLGAAMVDIAGTDLVDYLGARATSSGKRRSALVSWSDGTLIQPAYGLPVRTSMSSTDLPTNLERPFVWSVDHGQLVASSYIAGGEGQTLTVYFHGATDRSRFTLPRYERLSSMGQLDSGPLMFFSDPTLDLDSRMILSWFVGTEDLNLHSEIAHMVDTVAAKSKAKDVLLVGNSGGAFAALQVASYLTGSYVVAFNPQIQIDEYVPRISQTAHWSSFGRETVHDDPMNSFRMDAIERYRSIGFDQDVVLIQNPGDDQHYRDHFEPFKEAFETSGNNDRLRTFTPDLGPGHRVPAVPEYMEYVREELSRIEGSGKFNGVRARK